jgi:Flp pilus assembly pilin Flp
MNKLMIKLYVTLQALRDERGQDLIEYVLIGGVVAVGAIAGMGNLAANLNLAFGAIATKVSSYS